MDVRFTRDKYVIVFHDNTFSPRTVQGTYLLGDVKNFDLAQIQSLGRLLDGEAIPTLRNALTAVVLETNLSLVWLDVKDAAAVDSIINIQKDIMDFALFNGRDVNVLMGIPNGADDVRTSYLTSQNPNKSAVGFLTEKDDEELLALPNCQAWAPYWAEVTEGRIQDVKSRFNKKVFIWTVDLHDRIRDYVYGVGGAPDGILTNYSPLARGIHDSQ
jgi:glycerophosphoryl diester phosphodiesterase